LNKKDYDKAIECFEKVLELNPENDMAWKRLEYISVILKKDY